MNAIRARVRFLIVVVGAVLSVTHAKAGSAAGPSTRDLRRIADTYAGTMVTEGLAVGVGVGIILGDQPPAMFTYGLADVDNATPFSRDTDFEIGSVTKVFTTNLLGQAATAGTLSLNQTLSQFSAELGTLQPLTGQVTLEELADFTGGFPSYAPICAQSPTPGCLPSADASLQDYNAKDFLAFFQSTVPTNYQDTPPQPAASLPVPYFYSDYSIGLLGLLLGAAPNRPIDDSTLAGWWSLNQRALLDPLEMSSTYLFVPDPALPRLAQGYELAEADATVDAGQIAAITVTNAGGSYVEEPAVTIKGGGGSGAAAVATLDQSGHVTSITVQAGGDGYVAPPTVTFNGAGASTIAKAKAIVSHGKIAAIEVLDPGEGYNVVPMVTITNGRAAGSGFNATAVAHIANGHVTFVDVTDPGQGYVDPLSVSVAPGTGLNTQVSIWAAAGRIKSTIRDMSRFTAAALGETITGQRPIDPNVTAGFKLAQIPFACQGPNPLLPCAPPTTQSGLAWGITPADETNRFPEEVLKNGGLPGFSTQVLLMPTQHMGVVVFVNTRTGASDTGDEKTTPAPTIASNILHALFYETTPP
jgi:CubicO group peptidase (beta-lactamase class C family)